MFERETTTKKTRILVPHDVGPKPDTAGTQHADTVERGGKVPAGSGRIPSGCSGTESRSHRHERLERVHFVIRPVGFRGALRDLVSLGRLLQDSLDGDNVHPARRHRQNTERGSRRTYRTPSPDTKPALAASRRVVANRT